jgi:hypothetical protein
MEDECPVARLKADDKGERGGEQAARDGGAGTGAPRLRGGERGRKRGERRRCARLDRRDSAASRCGLVLATLRQGRRIGPHHWLRWRLGS